MPNIEKGKSYKLALEQAQKAIRAKCFLEAITIEESLLADRLWSTLNVGRTPQKKIPTLGVALEKWHPCKPDKNGNPIPPHKNACLFQGEMECFYPSLRCWWNKRCDLLHGIGKASQGNAPGILAKDFQDEAESVARFGLMAFRYVDAWVKRQIRKNKNLKEEKR